MRKTNNFILVIILVVLISGMGWFFWDRNGKFSTHQLQGEKQVWYCPMHPWIKSDKPGSVCPICGMALVPGHEHNQSGVKAAGVPGYVPLEISQQRQQLAGVRTALVTMKSIIKTIRAAGRVAYDPDLYKAEVQYVEDYIAYKRLNRRINSGSYTIEDAKRKLKEEELDLIRMGAAEGTIDQLQKNKFPDYSLLVTHAGGGRVFAEVLGADLGFIDVGQTAKIEIPDLLETFNGTIQSVDPVIDPASQMAQVRIYVDANTDLRPNMFARVTFPVTVAEGLFVPRDAIMDTGLRKIVFVQKSEGHFEPREIKTGWETDEGFEVKSGLKAGERIVISGNFLLDSESQVQAGLEETGDVHA